MFYQMHRRDDLRFGPIARSGLFGILWRQTGPFRELLATQTPAPAQDRSQSLPRQAVDREALRRVGAPDRGDERADHRG